MPRVFWGAADSQVLPIPDGLPDGASAKYSKKLYLFAGGVRVEAARVADGAPGRPTRSLAPWSRPRTSQLRCTSSMWCRLTLRRSLDTCPSSRARAMRWSCRFRLVRAPGRGAVRRDGRGFGRAPLGVVSARSLLTTGFRYISSKRFQLMLRPQTNRTPTEKINFFAPQEGSH